MSGLNKQNHLNTHVSVYQNKLATEETLEKLEERVDQLIKGSLDLHLNSIKKVSENWETPRNIVINCSSAPTNIGPMIGGSTTTTPVKPLDALDTFSVFCSGANAGNNKPGETGLRRIKVEGLDDNYEPISCEVDLSGSAVVNLPVQFLHISQVYGLEAGSSFTIEGTATISRNSDGQPYAQLNPTEDNTGWFMCPRGYKAVLYSVQRSGGTGGNFNLVLWKKGRTTYETIGIYNNVGVQFSITANLAVLKEGDSCYMNGITDTNSKAILYFQLIKLDEL
jgi:hypothetical protein